MPAPEKLIVIGAATPTIIRIVDDINGAGQRKLELVGFLDNAAAQMGPELHGHTILGGFNAITQFSPDTIVLANTIAGSIADRVETTQYFLSRAYRFTNIVHPGVNMKYVTMGIGNIVYENALIQPFVRIGNHCVISSNSGIAHESTIGDFCFVGPASYVCGKVDIDDGVYVGTGAKILPRLKIGRNARIGACALVNKPIPDSVVVMGVPARAI